MKARKALASNPITSVAGGKNPSNKWYYIYILYNIFNLIF